MDVQVCDTGTLIQRAHALHQDISRLQQELLAVLAELDDRQAWEADGAYDMGHWTAMQLGVSSWKAHRWVGAGHALRALPAVSAAFRRGELGIDKVVELTRFAVPEDEEALVTWAAEVPSGAIRHQGDLHARGHVAEVLGAERDRWLEWRYVDEGRRFWLSAELPATQGAFVAATLERLGDEVPEMPGEEGPYLIGARRADALVALCSAAAGDGESGGRPMIVVHASLETLLDGEANVEIGTGGVTHATELRRLLCDATVQTVIEAADGSVLGLGRRSRTPSAWMMHQLRHRDRECRFPGCGGRRFTHAHHIRWWSAGGRTDLDNLVLVCGFHHRLVHEHGWRVQREADGAVHWFRPGGVRYRAGPRAPDVAA